MIGRDLTLMLRVIQKPSGTQSYRLAMIFTNSRLAQHSCSQVWETCAAALLDADTDIH